jgi:putative transposase
MSLDMKRRTAMPRTRHKPEEIVVNLGRLDVLVSPGQSIADAVRGIGVTEVTYYLWRQEFGWLKTDQIKRMKELEAQPWSEDPAGSGGFLLSRFCPCTGHDFFYAVVGPIGGDFLQDIRDIGERFDAVKLAGFDDGIDRGGALASVF